jgi:hypothetical protein
VPAEHPAFDATVDVWHSRVHQPRAAARRANSLRFRAFATELAIVNDRVTTDQERELARSYAGTLEAYRDSQEMWNMKVEYPGTFDTLVKSPGEGVALASRQVDQQYMNMAALGIDAKYKWVPVEPRHEDLLKKYSIPTEKNSNEALARSIGSLTSEGTGI